MTYEGLFNSLRKKKIKKTDSDDEILNTCKDILIELGDLGYTYLVGSEKYTKKDSSSISEFSIMIQISLDKMTEDEVKKLLDNNFFYDQIVDYHDRTSEYLTTQGFKLKYKDWEKPLNKALRNPIGMIISKKIPNLGVIQIGNLLIWLWTAEYN